MTALVESHEDVILKQFARSKQKGTVGSTFLMTGPEAAKKRSLAKQVTQILNCGEAVWSPDCACRDCRLIEAGMSPAVQWIGEDEEARTIRIAEVRGFQDSLVLQAAPGKTKVYIFNGAERLTTEAQNALLKSLEEPPKGNVIILLAAHTRLLLPTIVSRATEVRVPAFTAGELEEKLEAAGLDFREAQSIARLASGSWARAEQAREAGWIESRQAWARSLQGDPNSFFQSFHSAARPKVIELFDFLVEWTRDLMIVSASGAVSQALHVSLAAELNSFLRGGSVENVRALFQDMYEAKRALARNANQKLTLTYAEIVWDRFLGT